MQSAYMSAIAAALDGAAHCQYTVAAGTPNTSDRRLQAPFGHSVGALAATAKVLWLRQAVRGEQ